MNRIFTLLFCLGIMLGHAQDFSELVSSLDSLLKEEKIPGAQLAIVDLEDSLPRLANFGMADLKNDIPVTNQTMFRIGSITKSFIAISAMMMVEQGKLSLKDRLLDHTSEVPFENKWATK